MSDIIDSLNMRPRIVSTRKPLQEKNTACDKCHTMGDATVYNSKWMCNNCLGKYLFDYTGLDSIKTNRWLWAIYTAWKEARDGQSPYSTENYGLTLGKKPKRAPYVAEKPIKFSSLFPNKPEEPLPPHMRDCPICSNIGKGIYPYRNIPAEGPFTAAMLDRLLSKSGTPGYKPGVDPKYPYPPLWKTKTAIYKSKKAWLRHRGKRDKPGAWLVGRNA